MGSDRKGVIITSPMPMCREQKCHVDPFVAPSRTALTIRPSMIKGTKPSVAVCSQFVRSWTPWLMSMSFKFALFFLNDDCLNGLFNRLVDEGHGRIAVDPSLWLPEPQLLMWWRLFRYRYTTVSVVALGAVARYICVHTSRQTGEQRKPIERTKISLGKAGP